MGVFSIYEDIILLLTKGDMMETSVTASPPPASLVHYGQQCSSAMGIPFNADMITGLTTTADVTKRLMEVAAQPAPPQVAINHDYIHKISGLKAFMDSLVSSEFDPVALNRAKSDLVNTIETEQIIQARRYTELSDILRKIHMIETMPSKTVSKWFQSLQDALTVSQFTFVGVYHTYGSDGLKLRFITEPITCGHVNRTRGWNHYVNLGRFACDITLTNTSFSVRVKGFSNNIKTYNNYIHPHVASNGEVCWGTASDPLLKAYNQSDLSGMLGIIYSVLTQYNYDNPYVGLYRFETNKELTLEEMEHTDITNTDLWGEGDVDLSDLLDEHFTLASFIPVYDFSMANQVVEYTKEHGIDISWILNEINPDSFKDHDIPKELSEGYGVFSQFMINLKPISTDDNGEVVLAVDRDRYGLLMPRSSTSEPKSVRSDAERLIYRYSWSRLEDDNYSVISSSRISSSTPYSRDVQMVRCQDRHYWSTNEYAKDKMYHEINGDIVSTLYSNINKGIADKRFNVGTIVVVSKFANRHGVDSSYRRLYGVVTKRMASNMTDDPSYSYHVYFPHLVITLQYHHNQLIGVPYEC